MSELTKRVLSLLSHIGEGWWVASVLPLRAVRKGLCALWV